jgi:hypothetical protein
MDNTVDDDDRRGARQSRADARAESFADIIIAASTGALGVNLAIVIHDTSIISGTSIVIVLALETISFCGLSIRSDILALRHKTV